MLKKRCQNCKGTGHYYEMIDNVLIGLKCDCVKQKFKQPKSSPEPTVVDYYVSCTKVHFANQKIAKQRLKELRKLPGHTPVKAYHCKHCGSWHLTSNKNG